RRSARITAVAAAVVSAAMAVQPAAEARHRVVQAVAEVREVVRHDLLGRFPVAERNALLPHNGLLNRLVAGLVDHAVFHASDRLVALAGFRAVFRDLLVARHRPFPAFGNHDVFRAGVLFGLALVLVARAFDLVSFGHAFGHHDGARAGRRR